MFPYLDQSVKSLVENERIMQVWTDDVMNAALKEKFPSRERDLRFGTGSHQLIKLNSQADRVEAQGVSCDIPTIEPPNVHFLPELWGAIQNIFD
jgi:hypothetical protein